MSNIIEFKARALPLARDPAPSYAEIGVEDFPNMVAVTAIIPRRASPGVLAAFFAAISEEVSQ